MAEPIKPVTNLKVGKRHFLMTACHRIPERSFHYHGKPLLCYRCLGLNGGFFLFTILQLILIIISVIFDTRVSFTPLVNQFISESFLIKFIFVVLTQLPFIIDGSIQAIWDRYTSNNFLRLLTGLIGGFGQFYFVIFLADLLRSFII